MTLDDSWLSLQTTYMPRAKETHWQKHLCLQAIWFCVQCILRGFQGLPITLLELNTLAHSICALVVYVLWWRKPLDVDRPYCIPIRDLRGMSAWAHINSGNSYEYLRESHMSPFNSLWKVINSWIYTSNLHRPDDETDDEDLVPSCDGKESSGWVSILRHVLVSSYTKC